MEESEHGPGIAGLEAGDGKTRLGGPPERR